MPPRGAASPPIFLFLGLVTPSLLKPIQKVWMSLAIVIGWFVTRVILTVLFYLVVTPIGLVAKLSGKRFLDINFDRGVDSYWIPRETTKFNKRSYENQFWSWAKIVVAQFIEQELLWVNYQLLRSFGLFLKYVRNGGYCQSLFYFCY